MSRLDRRTVVEPRSPPAACYSAHTGNGANKYAVDNQKEFDGFIFPTQRRLYRRNEDGTAITTGFRNGGSTGCLRR
jgi:hypothetical protein